MAFQPPGMHRVLTLSQLGFLRGGVGRRPGALRSIYGQAEAETRHGRGLSSVKEDRLHKPGEGVPGGFGGGFETKVPQGGRGHRANTR